jgi:hypothetical protein
MVIGIGATPIVLQAYHTCLMLYYNTAVFVIIR